MFRRVLASLALVCAGTLMAGAPPRWVKWEVAKQQADATGKPILVYAPVDSKGEAP